MEHDVIHSTLWGGPTDDRDIYVSRLGQMLLKFGELAETKLIVASNGRSTKLSKPEAMWPVPCLAKGAATNDLEKRRWELGTTPQRQHAREGWRRRGGAAAQGARGACAMVLHTLCACASARQASMPVACLGHRGCPSKREVGDRNRLHQHGAQRRNRLWDSKTSLAAGRSELRTATNRPMGSWAGFTRMIRIIRALSNAHACMSE